MQIGVRDRLKAAVWARMALFILVGIFMCNFVLAQNQSVCFRKRNLRVKDIFIEIERQTGLTVAYNETLTDVRKRVSLPPECNLSEALEIALSGSGLSVIYRGKMILVGGKRAQTEEQEDRDAKDGENMDESIDESIVVGYGTMYRRDVTSAISTYTPDEDNERQADSPEALLQGRIPGVSVTASSGTVGGLYRVSIRGIGSLTAGNEPLYVVDGLPLSNTNADAGGWEGESLNSLTDINPADIESIQILKDAASAAIYGSRATNGVILISTKTGHSGAARVTAEAGLTLSHVPYLKKLEVCGSDLYLEVQNEAIDNYNRQTGNSIPHLDNPYPGKPDFNWVDMIFRTAVSWKANVAVSGGSPTSNWYVSATARQTEGTVAGSRSDKYGIKANMKRRIKKWLETGININASYSYSLRVPDGNMGTSMLTHALENRPWDTPFNPDGSYTVKDEDLLHYNQLQALNEQNAYNKNYRAYGSAFIRLDVLKGLSVKTSIGGDFMYAEDHIYYSPEHMYGNSVGKLKDARKAHSAIVVENIINFNRRFDCGFYLDLMAGHSFQKDDTSVAYQTGQGFPSSRFDVNSVAAEYIDVTSSINSWALQSFIFRSTFNWKNKYLLTFTARADGSSKFAPENRYGFFPSVSGGWNISEEDFWTDRSINAKIRASYGATGNQEGIGAYAWQYLGTGGFNYMNESGIAILKRGNRDLKWEKADHYGFGTDLSFFSKTLTVSADIFLKDTKDLLYDKPTSTVTGFTNYICNIGSMRNTGLELAIGGQAGKGGFRWEGNFNISFIRNRLTSLTDEKDILTTDNYHALKVGEEVGSFYMIKMLGIYQYDEEVPAALYAKGVRAGDVIYEDVNGDGDIDTVHDRQFTGSANPVFTGGFNNTFRWKGFDLNIFLTFSYGNLIYQTWTGGLRLGNGNWPAQKSEALARWTGPGTSTKVPRAIYGMTWNSTMFVNTRFLHDGSYLRCRNLSIGYTLPKELTWKAGIESLRVYVQADNLFLLSPYRYIDPEVNTTLEAMNMGLDCMRTPQSRSFTFGFKIRF